MKPNEGRDLIFTIYYVCSSSLVSFHQHTLYVVFMNVPVCPAVMDYIYYNFNINNGVGLLDVVVLV